MQNRKVKVIDLKKIDYKVAWDYQEEVFKASVDRKIENRKNPDKEQKPTENYLLFCEHPHVFTLGKSGSINNLLLSEEELHEKSAQFYRINRGGDITYHGPGQVVVYPILDLENFFTDIHKYLRLLEEAVILTMADYGLDAGRIDGLTGVWLGHGVGASNPRKICAMGVKSSRWVTMHGIALNVNTDLNYFNHIVPCGIDDKAVTSMQVELQKDVSFTAVQATLLQHIASVFDMQLITDES